MINSIDLQKVRQFCDKAGYTSEITESGLLLVFLSADEDFGNSVGVFFEVTDNKWLEVFGLGVINVNQSNLAEALKRINMYNQNNMAMKAFIDSEGSVVVNRYELIDEYVSEEFVLENIVKFCTSCIWNFFKDNFADFVEK